ncbi:MAG: hypothetical protein U9R50_08915 [Campylobacterota bacterium]|nr:hypothetical protein [Campylobacterota bacterium]
MKHFKILKSFVIVFYLVLTYISPLQSLHASMSAGYSEYFVPGREEDLRKAFYALKGSGSHRHPIDLSRNHSIISVTAITNNTTIYWDHWENGYNFDPNNPSTADVTVTINKGETHKFESPSIPTSPRGTGTYYDSGDRFFTSGGPVSVARASWSQSISHGNPILGLAWAVYPVGALDTHHLIPVGTNSGFSDFRSTTVLIMAVEDNTHVHYHNGGTTRDVSLRMGRDDYACQ